MRTKNLLAGLALTAFGAVPAALPAAATVITEVAPGSFSLLDLGVGLPNSRQPIASPIAVNSGGITTITFSGGAATGDPAQASGVYAGTQVVISTSPLGPGDATTNYLTAQPDSDVANNVTVSYAASQTTLQIVWGTVDTANGQNLITTSSGERITGAQVEAAIGHVGNVWLDITGLLPFTSIAATDSNGNRSAFEFLPGVEPAVPVPEPASLVLLGGALLGLGLVRRRPKPV